MADNFFGITDTGKLRDNNEDTFIAQLIAPNVILACVIDGVGGYEGGEVAAEIARQTIIEELTMPFTDEALVLKEALILANQRIYEQKLKIGKNNNMACVLTAALIFLDHNIFHYAHVGDTRMYLLRDGSLVKVTKDHSFVGFLEDSGRLSEREAMQHPKRNEINKALGFDGNIVLDSDYIETGSSPFLPGDVLLLCSDGLTDMVNNEAMKSTLLAAGSLSEKGTVLINAANNAGGKDNITAVIVSNNKKPLKQKATKPLTAKKKDGSEDFTVADLPNKEEESLPPLKRKINIAVWVLTLLCLLLAACCWWLWKNSTEPGAPIQPIVQKAPNAGEKLLSDSIATALAIFYLRDSTFGKTITLSDTIFIRQDSLHINGAGLLLQRDSSYTGPAFFVTANNKYLLLENITFKDFATAIATQSSGLQLKNVVFQNTAVSIQKNVLLPVNDTVTGILRDSFYTKKNSTRK